MHCFFSNLTQKEIQTKRKKKKILKKSKKSLKALCFFFVSFGFDDHSLIDVEKRERQRAFIGIALGCSRWIGLGWLVRIGCWIDLDCFR